MNEQLFVAVTHQLHKKVSPNLSEEQLSRLRWNVLELGEFGESMAREAGDDAQKMLDCLEGMNINVILPEFNPYTGGDWPLPFDSTKGKQCGPFEWMK